MAGTREDDKPRRFLVTVVTGTQALYEGGFCFVLHLSWKQMSVMRFHESNLPDSCLLPSHQQPIIPAVLSAPVTYTPLHPFTFSLQSTGENRKKI